MKKLLVSILAIPILILLLAGCGNPQTVTAVDPYVMVEQSNRTAQAAQQNAEFYGSQLTATAQAPIIAITQTAAQFAMEQAYAAATSTSANQTQIAGVTQTAYYFTPTPDATQTAVFAQSYAEATAIHNGTELDKMKVERARISNQFWAVILPIFLLTILLALAYLAITVSRQLLHKPIQRDSFGDAPLLINTVNGEVIDIDASPNFSAGLHKSLPRQVFEQYLIQKFGFIPDQPLLTAERQDKVKERDQLTDHDVRQSAALHRLPRLQPGNNPQLPAPSMAIPEPAIGEFLLPDWDLIKNWDGKGGIPYFTAQGLKLIDVNAYPHLSVLGMTGMGKSRRYIRPLIACALALGDRVVVVGKSADYSPFENHSNVSLIKVSKFTEPAQAARYARVLEMIVEEMNRRDDVLSASHQSTWIHAGHKRTWIILDEAGNGLRMMPREVAFQARIHIEGLVNEGRKAGFNVVIANQRATGMSSILSQTGKAIFRVESDEEKAHKSLTGASSLAEGYYFARFGHAELAGAFEPTDQQLIEFMASRPVPVLERDNWIDGQIVEPKAIEQQDAPILIKPASFIMPNDSPQPKDEKSAAEIAQLANEIRARWNPSMNKSEVARLLGKSNAGWWSVRIDQIIEYLTSTSTDSTGGESAQNPDFHAV